MKQAVPYIILGMVFYGLGEWASKMYANTSKGMYAIWAVLSYAITGAAFLPALKVFNSLAVLSVVWAVTSAIVTLLIALALFHETLGPRQIAGILTGIVAIVLLSGH